MVQLKVAIIDDATMIRDLIKKFVRQNFPSAKIFEAADGKIAQSLLKKQTVDLILCDWEMPEMNGEELLRWSREQDDLKSVPFIMVTSRGDKDFVIKAIQSGVSDYLVKPFNNKQFLEKIYKTFKKHNIKVPESEMMSSSAESNESLSVLTAGKTVTNKKTTTKSSQPLPKGIALIRMANGEIKCALKQLDLKSMTGVFKQGKFMPTLLDQVSLDIEFSKNNQKQVMRINGFIQMLRAQDDHPDSNFLFIKIFFMDEDPKKRELISEYVGQFD